MPRPITQTSPRTIRPTARRRRPGRAICARHARAATPLTTASTPSAGSDAWMSVYEAPNTVPRGEKTSSNRSSQKAPDQRLDPHPPRQAELVLELPDHVGRGGPRGQGQVDVEEDEDAERQAREEGSAERERRGEDRGIADLLEPEPVGVERNELRDEAEGQEQEEQQADRLAAVHGAPARTLRCRGSRTSGTRAARPSARRSLRPSTRA